MRINEVEHLRSLRDQGFLVGYTFVEYVTSGYLKVLISHGSEESINFRNKDVSSHVMELFDELKRWLTYGDDWWCIRDQEVALFIKKNGNSHPPPSSAKWIMGDLLMYFPKKDYPYINALIELVILGLDSLNYEKEGKYEKGEVRLLECVGMLPAQLMLNEKVNKLKTLVKNAGKGGKAGKEYKQYEQLIINHIEDYLYNQSLSLLERKNNGITKITRDNVIENISNSICETDNSDRHPSKSNLSTWINNYKSTRSIYLDQ